MLPFAILRGDARRTQQVRDALAADQDAVRQTRAAARGAVNARAARRERANATQNAAPRANANKTMTIDHKTMVSRRVCSRRRRAMLRSTRCNVRPCRQTVRKRDVSATRQNVTK